MSLKTERPESRRCYFSPGQVSLANLILLNVDRDNSNILYSRILLCIIVLSKQTRYQRRQTHIVGLLAWCCLYETFQYSEHRCSCNRQPDCWLPDADRGACPEGRLISNKDTTTFDVNTDALCAGSAAFDPKLKFYEKITFFFFKWISESLTFITFIT